MSTCLQQVIIKEISGAIGQFSAAKVDEGGQCVWYDTCDGCVPGHADFNIAYRGPPKKLNQADESLLRETCPELFQDLGNQSNEFRLTTHFIKLIFTAEGESRNFCCATRQINDLVVNFNQLLSLVGRCPSCAHNLRMIFCALACDPDNSRFLAPNGTIDFEDEVHGNNVTLITAVDYYIRDSYTQAVYDSCKEVTNPSSNSLVIGTICGPWGEDGCNAHRYLEKQDFLFKNI